MNTEDTENEIINDDAHPEIAAAHFLAMSLINGLRYVETSKRGILLDSAFVAMNSIVAQYSDSWNEPQRLWAEDARKHLAMAVLGDL